VITLASFAIILSAVGVCVTALLAGLFLRDPVSGMAQVTHRAEDLPNIMTGRYIGFFLLALGATVYGDLKVITFLFAVFAFVSFFDTWTYARRGHKYAKHLQAGIASSLVVVVAGYASCNAPTTTALLSPDSKPSLTTPDFGGRA